MAGTSSAAVPDLDNEIDMFKADSLRVGDTVLLGRHGELTIRAIRWRPLWKLIEFRYDYGYKTRHGREDLIKARLDSRKDK